MLKIGEKIRGMRNYAGLTQAQLGSLSGLSQQRIAQYENGYRVPKDDTLDRIVKAIYDYIDSNDPGLMHADEEWETVFKSYDSLKAYIQDSDETETDYSAIIEPFSRLNRRGQVKVISYAWDLTDEERYRRK